MISKILFVPILLLVLFVMWLCFVLLNWTFFYFISGTDKINWFYLILFDYPLYNLLSTIFLILVLQLIYSTLKKYSQKMLLFGSVSVISFLCMIVGLIMDLFFNPSYDEFFAITRYPILVKIIFAIQTLIITIISSVTFLQMADKKEYEDESIL